MHEQKKTGLEIMQLTPLAGESITSALLGLADLDVPLYHYLESKNKMFFAVVDPTDNYALIHRAKDINTRDSSKAAEMKETQEAILEQLTQPHLIIDMEGLNVNLTTDRKSPELGKMIELMDSIASFHLLGNNILVRRLIGAISLFNSLRGVEKKFFFDGQGEEGLIQAIRSIRHSK